MTDDFSTDSIPVSSPGATQSPPPPVSSDEAVERGRHTALSQLAKDENVEAYAQERQDQTDYFDEGKPLDQGRTQKWFQRAHKALTDAALEAQGVKLNEQGEQQPQQPPPGYVPGDEAERAITEARKTGAAQMRINQYFGDNQEARDNVIQWHQAMDPQGVVAQWLIDNESPMAGPIMQRTTDNPEALRQLAELPPHERSRWLSKLEGHLEAEMRIAQQLAGQQAQWQQERRVTQAPPPIRPPRGSSNAPSDMHRLAGKDNVEDYVKMRRQQERRYKEKWES